MAYDQILNLNLLNNDPGQIKYCRVSFVVEYIYSIKMHGNVDQNEISHNIILVYIRS